MTVPLMERLKEYGWYLSNHGYNLVSDFDNITDLEKILRRCLDFDLKEIGSGQGDIHQGNIVLQIQKARNVAAPKGNEESRGAPRMLKLSLTDGKNNYQAIEVEHLSSISLNTPPGTKILFKTGSIPMLHGIILLRPCHINQVLGGRVSSLVEKWELNKKLAHHTRVRPTEEGGPPPWIPFGTKIIKFSDKDKNFKALAEKEKTSKENAEFEAQRKDAIAEAAKQGSKKVFGGGTKQLLDHSVQKIVDQGFSIEQAEYALRVNRNNVEKAIKSLQKTSNKHREPRELRGKRFDKKSEESKPSSGKISLFDFLEDKLPIQHEPIETNSQSQNSYAQSSGDNIDKTQSKIQDTQSGKGGRSQKGNRGYQAPPRHTEETKVNKRSSNNSVINSQYNGGGNTQQNKPPRFQRNQDNHQQQDSGNRGSSQRTGQFNDYKNSYVQSHPDTNYVESQGKHPSTNRNYNHLESDTKNRNFGDASYSRHNQNNRSNTVTDKNYKDHTATKYQSYDNNRTAIGFDVQRNSSENHYTNNQNVNVAGSPWVWRVGDKCMAKYWEDNRYYNAEVTAVSERTCMVQFKGFENYEEVYQVDCIPITDDIHPDGNKRQDQRGNHRQTRYEQNQNHIIGMEFRRGGSGSNPGNKNHGNKKRAPARSTQAFYQPPAQRNNYPAPANIQDNSLL